MRGFQTPADAANKLSMIPILRLSTWADIPSSVVDTARPGVPSHAAKALQLLESCWCSRGAVYEESLILS